MGGNRRKNLIHLPFFNRLPMAMGMVFGHDTDESFRRWEAVITKSHPIDLRDVIK